MCDAYDVPLSRPMMSSKMNPKATVTNLSEIVSLLSKGSQRGNVNGSFKPCCSDTVLGTSTLDDDALVTNKDANKDPNQSVTPCYFRSHTPSPNR